MLVKHHSAPSRVTRRKNRRRVRALGVFLVVLGTVLLAFVVNGQWGTGLTTERAQARLREELRTDRTMRDPRAGEPIGMISIPRIRLEMAFVEGIGERSLSLGPGHYPGSPLPGEGGNVAIAGHRTTHLAPFWSLDALVPGDRIALRTASGSFLYRVTWSRVTAPDVVSVVGATSVPSLTLTTCNPRFRATQRLVVRAVQIYGRTPDGFIGLRARGLVAGVERLLARRPASI